FTKFNLDILVGGGFNGFKYFHIYSTPLTRAISLPASKAKPIAIRSKFASSLSPQTSIIVLNSDLNFSIAFLAGSN
ncbi:hypothetical protein, partial [Xenorhabdus bovienii]|uniref:hypothetical protein n=1 Tax=Xenorhabdus bovienii TaxID=40576 RepID=UPI001E5BF371